MSKFSSYPTGEESPSSDEKMDTGSDTFHSQDTPNSDSDDPENIRTPQVLRLTAPDPQDSNSTQSSDSDDFENALQNPGDTGLTEPTNKTSTPRPVYKQDISTLSSDSDEPGNILRCPEVLRLSEPGLVESHNDSLETKMFTPYIDSPETIPKKHIDIKIRHINHIESETQAENHIYGSEIQTIDQIDPEIQPINHIDPEIRTIKQSDPKIRTINHIDPEIRPIKHIDSEIQPKNNINSEIQPINNIDGSEIRTINQIDPEIWPMNQSNQEIRPINHINSEIQPKSHIDGSEIRTLNLIDPEIQPINQSDPEIRTINDIDPESRPINQSDPEIRTINHIDPESRPINQSDPVIRTINHIDPEIRTINQSDPVIRTINHIDPDPFRPQNLGISPPKFSSTLTLTTSHPLMGLGSPEDYPDLIPKRIHRVEDDKELSLSSIEDERHTNGFYSQQRNTSKNNLYFSENFVTAESHVLSDSLDQPPDVTRVKVERKKLVPNMEKDHPHWILGRNFEGIKIDCARKTPQSISESERLDDVSQEFHSGVDWSESPSQLRAIPNFQLPIEMSTNTAQIKEKYSPDVISSSTPSSQDKSTFQALLDPYTGSVALRHTPRTPNIPASPARRKIQLPVDLDCCSLDSLSDASLESDEEPVQRGVEPQCEPRTCDPQLCDQICSDDEDTKCSKSTNTVSYSDTIPEYSAAEELSNERAWLSVRDGQRRVCDMKVIEPYKRVVSHGGYSGGLALVVFSACHLPDNSRQDYTYVMDNLFLYVIWTLERLVTDEYILVYLHGSAGRRRLPTFHWLHQCYKLIDRRLRKSLKHMYLVHPTFWLKSFVILTKPFISSKFLKKLSYVKSLDELMETVPVEPNAIPEIVKQFDANRKR